MRKTFCICYEETHFMDEDSFPRTVFIVPSYGIYYQESWEMDRGFFMIEIVPIHMKQLTVNWSSGS